MVLGCRKRENDIRSREALSGEEISERTTVRVRLPSMYSTSVNVTGTKDPPSGSRPDMSEKYRGPRTEKKDWEMVLKIGSIFPQSKNSSLRFLPAQTVHVTGPGFALGRC